MAIPIPEIRLDVVEGSQDVPLTGVRVARADDPTGSWLGDEAPAFDFLMEDADSPLTLPDLDAQRPICARRGRRSRGDARHGRSAKARAEDGAPPPRR